MFIATPIVKVRALLAAAVVSRLLFAAEVHAQNAPSATSKVPIREKIAQVVTARFEQEVRFTVAHGAAVLVEFGPNPYDVVDFAVYSDGDRLIWFDYGELTAKDYRKVSGSLEQIGRAPCAALVRWTAVDDGLDVGLRLTADRAEITKAVAAIDRGDLEWSLRVRTHNLALPEIIPESERIAGFVRLWSEVKYNFAFFDRVPELDWDQVLDDYLPRVQRAETAPSYYRVLRECMSLLRDGHSDVWGPSDDPTATVPLLLAEVEGKAVIIAIRPLDTIRVDSKRQELEAAGLAVGDEVTAIDGEPVGEILRRKIHPYISASTPQHLATKAYPRLLDGDPGSTARLSVRTLRGEEREVMLTRAYSFARRPVATRSDSDVGNGVFYVSLDSFSSDRVVERFEAAMPRVRGARGLILDLRENGGGSTSHGNRIIGFLTDRPLQGSRWKTRLYRPAFRAWGNPEGWHEGHHQEVEPAGNPFLGPVVVLTSPRTLSAAEDFLVVLKASGRARLVGERTGGSTGQPLSIEGLPAGGGARVCTKRDMFPDGTEFVGIGVIPDVEVRPTAADIAAGRDVVFEQGLAEMRRLIER